MKLLLAGDWLLAPRMSLNVYTTSAVVTGLPSLNLAPGRRLIVQDSLLAACVQEVASCGSSLPDGLSMIRPADASPTTYIALKSAVVSGSMLPVGVLSPRL
ncbi:MAG: hypothetical protein ABSF03_19745 [Streptosporangiaceae bacterium]